MKPVSLKQIAKELGISITTVSKALNDYPDVSAKTKKKVKDLALKLDYSPNSFALGLRKNQSKTIGLIIPDNVHYFFSSVIKGILEVAEKHDYLVIVMQSNEDYELEKKQVDLLIAKGVAGILISLSNRTHIFDHLNKIINNGIPLLLFDKISKNVNCSKVFIDDRKSAYEAVTYLIKKGYRRIAHFRGDLNPQNSIDRFLGYKKALADNNIEFDPSLVYLCNSNSDFEDGYKNAEKLINDHQDNVDALFTVNDLLAIGAIKYFNKNNIKIPEQMALMGFSNWFMASVVTPSLSTVEQNGLEMGKKAADILFNEINCVRKGLSFQPQQLIIPTELILRETC
jgi:LacI family transcriptional regulator